MNLRKRFWTALILLLILFVVIQWASRPVFFLVLQAAAAVALLEFYALARRRKLLPLAVPGVALSVLLGLSFFIEGLSLGLALFAGLLGLGVIYLVRTRTIEAAMAFTGSLAVTVFGAVYIGFTLGHLFPLWDLYGPPYIYFLLAVVFLGDTGAYFVGKALGRHKMAVIASPNKTWEGAAGGLLAAGLGAWAARTIFLPVLPLAEAVVCGILVQAVAQMSDPFESLFKRAAGVKDSSNLLPGHGGFLDRVDSLILATPFFYYFLRIFWK